MFTNSKKIKELEDKINKIMEEQCSFIKHCQKVMIDLQDSSKRSYMWEIREEERQMMEDGKKYRKIIKIIE